MPGCVKDTGAVKRAHQCRTRGQFGPFRKPDTTACGGRGAYLDLSSYDPRLTDTVVSETGRRRLKSPPEGA
jgi:hypothetical protein